MNVNTHRTCALKYRQTDPRFIWYATPLCGTKKPFYQSVVNVQIVEIHNTQFQDLELIFPHTAKIEKANAPHA